MRLSCSDFWPTRVSYVDLWQDSLYSTALIQARSIISAESRKMEKAEVLVFVVVALVHFAASQNGLQEQKPNIIIKLMDDVSFLSS